MNKRFVSLLATVAIMLNLSIFSWGGTSVSAAQYTETGEEIVIWEESFDRDLRTGRSYQELYDLGGFDFNTNGEQVYLTGTSNTSRAMVPGNKRGIALSESGAAGTTEFYLPDRALFTSGTYTFSYDYYRGNNSSADRMYLTNQREYTGSESLNVIVNPSGSAGNYGYSNSGDRISKGRWYKIVIIVNLDTDTETLYVYNWSGSFKSSMTKTYSFDTVSYISWRSTASESMTEEANSVLGNASAVDNFKVTYKGSGVSARYASGNIYSTDFSDTIYSNPNYDTEGGWDVYSNSGRAAGRYGVGSSFCPSGAPYYAAEKSNHSSVYYLSPGQIFSTGVYNINFDTYVGSSASWAAIYFHSRHSTEGDGEALVSGKSVGRITERGITKGVWYNIDMTIDLDYRTYTFVIFNADGTISKAWDGEYSDETFGCIEFQCKSSSEKTASSNTGSLSAYSMAIDNLSISHYTGSMIYSEDFESGSMLSYVRGQHEAGGWDYSSSEGGIVSTGYDSDHGFAFVHADGKIVDSDDRQSSSDFYIPKVHVHDTGYYSLTFNLYVGNAEEYVAVYLNDTDVWDSSTFDMAFRKKTDGESKGHVNKGKWYKIKVNINLDTGAVNSYAYDPSSSKPYKAVANNGEFYDTKDNAVQKTRLRHIAFRGELPDSSQISYPYTVPENGGPIMDNLIIHYFGSGSVQKEMGESFDFGHLRSVYGYDIDSKEYKQYGQSTWDLYDRTNYANNHFVDGGVHGSAMAFAPVFRPGKARGASANESTEYWVDGALIKPMGQWRIGFWYKLGTSLDSTETLDISDNATHDKSTHEIIYTLTNSAIEKGKWYHLDAVLDFDIGRKNVRITDEKGNVVDEVNETIGKEFLTYFSWHSTGGTEKTLTVDDCLIIDDIGMKYNGASVNDTRVNEVQGITFDDTNSKLSYQAKIFNELFIDDSDNTKDYKAILAAYDDGDLVYVDYGSYTHPGGCPANDYWTTHHRNIPYSEINGGNVDGLTFRMFVWDWNTDTNDTTGNPLSKIVEVTKPAAE